MAEREAPAQARESAHRLTVAARERAEIAGVTEVESFDENTVVLTTVCGELTVEGEGLHVSTLDIARGAVVVEGKINGMSYSSTAPRPKGLRARLFG